MSAYAIGNQYCKFVAYVFARSAYEALIVSKELGIEDGVRAWRDDRAQPTAASIACLGNHLSAVEPVL